MKHKNVFTLSTILAFLSGIVPVSARIFGGSGAFRSTFLSMFYIIFRVDSAAPNPELVLAVKVAIFGLVSIMVYLILNKFWTTEYKASQGAIIAATFIISWISTFMIPQETISSLYAAYSIFLTMIAFLLIPIAALTFNFKMLGDWPADKPMLNAILKVIVYSVVLFFLLSLIGSLDESLQGASGLTEEIYDLAWWGAAGAIVLTALVFIWHIIRVIFGVRLNLAKLGANWQKYSNEAATELAKMREQSKILNDPNLKNYAGEMLKASAAMQKVNVGFKDLDKKTPPQLQALLKKSEAVMLALEDKFEKYEQTVAYYENLVDKGTVKNPDKIKEIESFRKLFDGLKKTVDEYGKKIGDIKETIESNLNNYTTAIKDTRTFLMQMYQNHLLKGYDEREENKLEDLYNKFQVSWQAVNKAGFTIDEDLEEHYDIMNTMLDKIVDAKDESEWKGYTEGKPFRRSYRRFINELNKLL